MNLSERLALLGGADPSWPLEPNNKARHLAVGALLLIIGAWAFLATTGAFYSNLRAPLPLAILAGALIAAVILSIDILITVTPLEEDGFWPRARLIAVRGMISLAMGLVISHSTILFMYGDGLTAIATVNNERQVALLTDEVKAKSIHTQVIASAQQQRSKDLEELKREDATLAAAEGRVKELEQAWKDDFICVNGNKAANGDRCGDGPASRALKKSWDDYREETLPRVRATHATRTTALKADIQTRNTEISDATASLEEEIQNAIDPIRSNMGLTAQTAALLQLLKTDLFAWLWPIFFIVIDLAVALMKGLLPESDFDRARRTRRQLDGVLASALLKSPRLEEVLAHAAASQARVEIARVDKASEEQLANLAAKPKGATSGRGSPRPVSGAAVAVTATVAISILSIALIYSLADEKEGTGPASGQKALPAPTVLVTEMPAPGSPGFCEAISSDQGLAPISEAIRGMADNADGGPSSELTRVATLMERLGSSSKGPLADQFALTSQALVAYVTSGFEDAAVAERMSQQWIALGESLEEECDLAVA